MSVGRGVPYPGGFHFVRMIADEQQDGNLAGQIGQLGPVQRALSYIQNAATSADDRSREELLNRAEKEIEVLRAGAAAIAKAVQHVTSTRGEQPREVAGRFAMEPKPPRGESMRPVGAPGITSAPIDAEAMGVSGSAKPPDWDEQQAAAQRTQYENAEAIHRHIQKAGTDERAQGAPPRQDTGVNQSQNQTNVDQSIYRPMSARSWKEGGNAPDPARDTPETWDSYPVQGIRPRDVMETRPDESPLQRLAAGEGPADDPQPPPDPAIMRSRLMPQPSEEAKRFNAQQEPVDRASTTPIDAPPKEQTEQKPKDQPKPATQSPPEPVPVGAQSQPRQSQRRQK